MFIGITFAEGTWPRMTTGLDAACSTAAAVGILLSEVPVEAPVNANASLRHLKGSGQAFPAEPARRAAMRATLLARRFLRLNPSCEFFEGASTAKSAIPDQYGSERNLCTKSS